MLDPSFPARFWLTVGRTERGRKLRPGPHIGDSVGLGFGVRIRKESAWISSQLTQESTENDLLPVFKYSYCRLRLLLTRLPLAIIMANSMVCTMRTIFYTTLLSGAPDVHLIKYIFQAMDLSASWRVMVHEFTIPSQT
jgi:hypothetical protein